MSIEAFIGSSVLVLGLLILAFGILTTFVIPSLSLHKWAKKCNLIVCKSSGGGGGYNNSQNYERVKIYNVKHELVLDVYSVSYAISWLKINYKESIIREEDTV